ncbi:MAG: oligosaccharide flippase family protein [archaeon]
MTLFTRVFSVLSFGTLQVIFSKLISFINFAILVRLLTHEEIGIIGLAGGYMALLGFLMVLPENVFIRDFKKMQGRLNEYISSFFFFGVMRSLVLFVVAGGMALHLSSLQSDPRLTLYFLLLVGTTLLNSLVGPFREAFYGAYRQARITFVDVISNLLLLTLIGLLYFQRDVIVYGWLQLGVAMLGLVWWIWNAHRHLHFSFFPPTFQLAIDSLRNFSIWNHLAGSVIRLVYQIDIVILGFFVGLGVVGDYAVALTLANVFFVFPQMIQKVLSLSLSSVEDKRTLENMLGIAVRYNTLFSVAQWGAFLIMGPWLISLLGPESPAQIWTYSIYLVSGVTLFNIARPWSSLAVSKIPPKDFFFKLFFLPSMVAVPIYWYAAAQLGALGVAKANLVTFFILGGWLIIYMHIHLKLIPRIFYFSPHEKHFLGKIQHVFHSRGMGKR